MFDVSSVNKRYFEIKLTAEDNSGSTHTLKLEVEPPKLKALKQLLRVRKTDEDNAINELCSAVKSILKKNKGHKSVPDEYIESLDLDELRAILSAYFNWLGETKNSDPN